MNITWIPNFKDVGRKPASPNFQGKRPANEVVHVILVKEYLVLTGVNLGERAYEKLLSMV